MPRLCVPRWVWCLVVSCAIRTGTARVGAAAAPAVDEVRVWITTAQQTHLLTPVASTSFAPDSGATPLTIAVADDEQYQRMVGFGGSMTESSAWLLFNALDDATRAKVMARLFGSGDGIALSFLRQPVGASDFSLSHYSYDDMSVGQTDFPLDRFSIARDTTYIIPALLAPRSP
jgi:glucosylceramidase